MNTITRNRTLLAATLCAALSAPQAQAGDLEWIVAPYLWAPTVSSDLETDTPPDGGTADDTAFSDIVDKIEGAFELHVEAQGEQFGFFADFTYLGLGDSKEFDRFETDSDLDTRLFDAAFVWSPGAGAYEGGELFAGLRYIDVDVDVELDPINPAFATTRISGGDSYTDFMVGGRYLWKLSDRWSLALRGDTSFGDTEGSWEVAGTLGYRTENGQWMLGYRHLSVEVGNDDASAELSLSGPVFGYGFRF